MKNRLGCLWLFSLFLALSGYSADESELEDEFAVAEGEDEGKGKGWGGDSDFDEEDLRLPKIESPKQIIPLGPPGGPNPHVPNDQTYLRSRAEERHELSLLPRQALALESKGEQDGDEDLARALAMSLEGQPAAPRTVLGLLRDDMNEIDTHIIEQIKKESLYSALTPKVIVDELFQRFFGESWQNPHYRPYLLQSVPPEDMLTSDMEKSLGTLQLMGFLDQVPSSKDVLHIREEAQVELLGKGGLKEPIGRRPVDYLSFEEAQKWRNLGFEVRGPFSEAQERAYEYNMNHPREYLELIKRFVVERKNQSTALESLDKFMKRDFAQSLLDLPIMTGPRGRLVSPTTTLRKAIEDYLLEMDYRAIETDMSELELGFEVPRYMRAWSFDWREKFTDWGFRVPQPLSEDEKLHWTNLCQIDASLDSTDPVERFMAAVGFIPDNVIHQRAQRVYRKMGIEQRNERRAKLGLHPEPQDRAAHP